MSASDQVDQVISIRLERTEPKLVGALRDAVDESEEMAYGDRGPIANDIGVFFTVPNSKVRNAFAPYLVTDRGIRVGYMEKTGMFKSSPSVSLVSRESIHRAVRTHEHDFDGSQTRKLELRDQHDSLLLSVMTMYVAGTGENYAAADIRAITQGLALPPDDSVDF